MPSNALSPEKQAEIEDLTRAFHEAVEAEIGELAEHLATTDDAQLFGDNEFRIRALAHRIAAKAVEQHLARKKTRCGVCGTAYRGLYDQRPRHVRALSCGDRRVYLDLSIRRVYCSRCGGVKR
jgi:transposase